MKNRFSILFLLLCTGLGIGCQKSDGEGDAPLGPDTAEVRGHLIDIRTLAPGEKIFPQHDKYLFGEEVADLFDEPMVYAAGLMESRGAEAVRSGNARTIYMASECDKLATGGWLATGSQFQVGEITYYLYKYMVSEPGAWIDIPNDPSRKYSTLVFHPKLRVAGTQLPGTVITAVPELRQGAINNVCMTILPNGQYIAACTGSSGPGSYGATLFVSNDRGESWQVLSKDNLSVNGVANYFNLFVHGGKLYLMGTGVSGRNVLISCSEDNGQTWSYPADKTTGLLFVGDYHSSSVPVVVSGGRLWRAMEVNDGTNKNPVVLSAPEDADLLNADNWTCSAAIPHDATWTVDTAPITELIEGNMVATPDGKLYNILRASSQRTSKAAARVTVTDPATLTFTAPGDFISFPGGGKKFTIRYDAQSRRYWTITNPASSTHYLQKHNGIYTNGITYDLIRNRLVLCYSSDLTTWIQAHEVVASEDPFFHGFQYVDWLFDGEDIVAVSRVACPESRGLPTRQHDANLMSFFRIRDFRQF